ncbi:hypothetical protein A2Y47_02685 [Candidatus Giovannonibacteria bacterium RIFCSPLOWO2_12_43_8]|uniref:Uncharacterized protein n=4 Tax=Candidatus Giovannoniibacteriota TaxID=1752738 RepID=A0A1F5Y186_9BACT|nr:MAG: hypothetical protein A2Y47_02685 [Candidatus Giovannonibacteria bacterium RIFCSPLOWO2_12_43_8]
MLKSFKEGKHMTKRRVKSKRGNNRKIQKKGEKIQKGGFELKPIGNIARGEPSVIYTAVPRGSKFEYWD